MAENLTTLANVKRWLEAEGTTQDDLIDSLIAGASQLILGYITRDSLISRTRTETYNGFNNRLMVLRCWPVTAVSAIAADGVAIAPNPSPPTGSGYTVDLWDGVSLPGALSSIVLNGQCFNRGLRNISVTYTAGYLVSGEPQAIPGDPFRVKSNQTLGTFSADAGVTFDDGAALAKVAGGPTAGQYAVDANGVYTFAAADAARIVLLSYSFIPPDIENACYELVGEQFRYRSRIGEVSRALPQGGSVSFSQKAMSEYVKSLLQPYRAVIPLFH